ncbi:hypothetical protein BDR07DRAFT_55508 [Suillus spraguei]|nr:hypothetical protein BDR07DRAFT_55508 [Suillus spraguei]
MCLFVVAALANPLSISQISKLLRPSEGRYAETVLAQLWFVMDIPIDSSLLVKVYYSPIRDYVANPASCSIPQVQCMCSLASLFYVKSRNLPRCCKHAGLPEFP